MKTNTGGYENLAKRTGFNASVRHIKSVLTVLDRISGKENLADVVLELIDEKTLEAESVQPLVNMILLDKLGYRSVAVNLVAANDDLNSIADSVKGWNGVDLVVLYHHPELGAVLVNPKNAASVARLDRLAKYELLNVYAGAFGKKVDPATLEKAAEAVAEIFSGKKVKPSPAFLKGDCSYKAPKAAAPRVAGAKTTSKATAKPARASAAGSAKKAQGARGRTAPVVQAPEVKPQKVAAAAEAAAAAKPTPSVGRRMTPMYSVPVTNELFHNGNVEAWKRIIESYRTKHPDCDVIVYYERERITNLNALFKWGKVKRGTTIQFAVVGETIADVAKLVRYLQQGASPMFEAFLKGPVNSVLPLF